MPFGLTNATSVFQALINNVFRDFINRFVVVYLDDILIFSESMEEHISHVRQILARLLEKGYSGKLRNVLFMLTCLFLGYIIQKESVQAHPEKIRAVEDWPIPKTRKELHQF